MDGLIAYILSKKYTRKHRQEVDAELAKKISTYNNDSSYWDTTPTEGSKKPVTSEGIKNLTNDLDERLTQAEEDIAEAQGDIVVLENKVDILIGDNVNQSAQQIAATEVAKVVASAPQQFDTLKEIADWIENDTTGAAKMANDIENLKSDKLDTYASDSSQWDTIPTNGSVKPVTSSAIFAMNFSLSSQITAADSKATEAKNQSTAVDSRLTNEIIPAIEAIEADTSSFDTKITNLENNKLSKYSINSSEWDDLPTTGSSKPVTSNGIYTAINSLDTAFESKIQTVNSRIDTVNDRVTGLTSNYNTLNQTVNTLSSTVTSNYNTLSSSIAANASDIARLNTTTSNHTTAISSLSTRITNNSTAITSLQNAVASANDNISSLSSSIDDLNDQYTALNSQIDGIDDDIAALQSDISQLDSRLNTFDLDAEYDSTTEKLTLFLSEEGE